MSLNKSISFFPSVLLLIAQLYGETSKSPRMLSDITKIIYILFKDILNTFLLTDILVSEMFLLEKNHPTPYNRK